MFSPSSASEIVSGSEDKTLIVWNATGGSKKLTLKGHESRWDLKKGQWKLTLLGHDDSVSSVTFSPDGTEIVSGSFDKTVRVWCAKSGLEIHKLPGRGGHN
jgi:WD40 repeat protein